MEETLYQAGKKGKCEHCGRGESFHNITFKKRPRNYLIEGEEAVFVMREINPHLTPMGKGRKSCLMILEAAMEGYKAKLENEWGYTVTVEA